MIRILQPRYCDEELFAVLPGAELDVCIAVAERIRQRISDARLKSWPRLSESADTAPIRRNRTRSNRRVYGSAEKRTLAFIRRSRELGFTLEEIRALLAVRGPERAPCADVHKIAGAHLANVRKKLSDLVKLEAILAETVAQCSGGATLDCPVLDILDAGRQS